MIDYVNGPMMYVSALEIADGAIAVAYGMEDGSSSSEICFRYIVASGH